MASWTDCPQRIVRTRSTRPSVLLQPILRDGDGNWVADYVRLRFAARA